VPVEAGGVAVAIAARGQVTVEAGALFDGFRDLSYAYRYGPPPYDVIAVGLSDGGGRVVSEVVHLPAGLDRPVEPEIGLAATARPGVDGDWELAVTTRRLAQWVVVEVPGFQASDSWFHLAPGASRTVALVPGRGPGGPERPSGQVRALNSQAAARIVIG
jgi:beta-mannosidase